MPSPGHPGTVDRIGDTGADRPSLFPEKSPRLWALAGGKGGAGRSLLAANLGIRLARDGHRVVLCDLDLQGGNLHLYLGCPLPSRTLLDLTAGQVDCLADLQFDTSFKCLSLIGGMQRGIVSTPPVELVSQVIDQSSAVAADIVIVDCGSGRSPEILTVLSAAETGILVTTPEPAALESLCLFTEAHLRRCLARALPAEQRLAIEERLRQDGLDPARVSFRHLMTRLASFDLAAFEEITRQVNSTRLELVLNMVQGESDREAAASLASSFRKCFGVKLWIAGLVEHDPSVLQSVHKRRPLAQQFPNTAATVGIGDIAERLLSRSDAPPSTTDTEWEDLTEVDHYRALEIAPTASPKEVHSAYQILRRAYAPETTYLAPLLEAQALRDTLARIEDAYRTLIFVESRADYDHSIGTPAAKGGDRRSRGVDPAGVPPLEVAGTGSAPRSLPDADDHLPAGEVADEGAAHSAEAARAPTDVGAEPPEAAADGEALRRERQRQNRSLETISAIIKVRPAHLQAIEEERFEDLPAEVYVRGFLQEYANCLGLAGDQVARLYVQRYRDWLRSHPRHAIPRRNSG